MNTDVPTFFGAFIKITLVTLFIWVIQIRNMIYLFYPKHYVNPPKRIRKIFRIKVKMIPKFLYYRLFYLGFGFVPFSIVWNIVCLLINSVYMRHWIFTFYWCILIFENLVFVIFVLMFKYARSKEQKERMKKIKQKDKAEKKKRKQLEKERT